MEKEDPEQYHALRKQAADSLGIDLENLRQVDRIGLMPAMISLIQKDQTNAEPITG